MEKLNRLKAIRFRPSEFAAIEVAAERFNFSESELIRRAIRLGLSALGRRRCRVDDLSLADLPREEQKLDEPTSL